MGGRAGGPGGAGQEEPAGGTLASRAERETIRRLGAFRLPKSPFRSGGA